MKRLLFIAAAIALCVAGWYSWWLVRMERIETLQERFSQYDEIAFPDTYVKAVLEEKRMNIRFPLGRPAYAVVEYNTPWQLSRTLRPEEMEEIRLILNDTASYAWGELGTPFYDAFVVWYDSTDSPVGLTKVNYEGQMYSYPHIPRMKWGIVTTDVLNRMITIVERDR